MTIESVKGNVTVETARQAAEWIAEYRPAFVSVDGSSVDYAADADVEAIEAAVRDALTYVS